MNFIGAHVFDTRDAIEARFPFRLIANKLETLYFRTDEMRRAFYRAHVRLDGRPKRESSFALLEYPQGT